MANQGVSVEAPFPSGFRVDGGEVTIAEILGSQQNRAEVNCA